MPKDLLAFIRLKQSEGHHLLLAGDKNETLLEGRYADGCAKPGSMELVFDACGLEDALLLHHGVSPSTSTRTAGRYIDSIHVSGISVTAAGILPLNSTKDSDHFPFFLDWKADLLLGGPATPLTRPVQRRLSVKNAICVDKYVTASRAQSDYHNLETRLDRMTSVFKENGRVLTAHSKQSLINMDAQFVEIRKAAEKGCSRKGIYKIDWCPEYKAAGQMVSYLEYRLKDRTRMGDGISQAMGRKAGLTVPEMDHYYHPAKCRQDLKDARAWLKILKDEADQRRVDFQEVSATTAANGDDKKKAGILKAIKDSEQSVRRFRKIANALGKTRCGLDKVIISNADGSETILTGKDDMDRALLQRNFTHYGQANDTVFGADGKNAHLIDPDDPTNIIDKLVDGTAGFDIRHLSTESQEWLGELVRNCVNDVSMDLTEEDFISHYKSMPERKSSSPSTIHVGHYKVAANCEDGTLRRISLKIMQLALWASVPLPRWGQCILTMLEKGKGPGLENLRIIQIVESDLNFILGRIWGKRFCTPRQGFDPAQYATKGQLCHSAALTTVLFCDIHRQTREEAAVAMLDARACFDRNLPALSIPVSLKFGLPKEAALFLYRTLRGMSFRVATAYGVSLESFSAMQNSLRPLQGLGQGLGSAPPGHVAVADVGNKALAKHHPSAVLRHPCPTVAPHKQQKSMFMDDTTLYANLAGLTRHAMAKFGWSAHISSAHILQHLIRTYSRYLWTSGGCLNLAKCYWYLMRFTRRKGGKYDMLGLSHASFPMEIREEASTGQVFTVPQLAPGLSQRSLGIQFAPDGASIGQREVLLKKARTWANMISASNLTAIEVWTAYISVLWPGLCYPLAVSSLSITDLHLVQQKLSTIIRNSLHLNRSFPDALFYGAKKFGGLGIVSLAAQQLVMKLNLFLRHMRLQDAVGRQIGISMGCTQLELGIDTQFLRLNYASYHHFLTPTWLTHLWKLLSLSLIELRHSSVENVWTPSLQRENDSFVMVHILQSGFSKSDQRVLNEWRVYLRLLSLADATVSNGTHVTLDVYHGWKSYERRSSLHWPVASRPHRDLLPTWQRFLATLTVSGRTLKSPLGPWFAGVSCHNCWNFKLDPMDGLWRYDPLSQSYAELLPSASRSLPHRRVFYHSQFVDLLSLEPAAALADWRFADITEKGHHQRTTAFLTVTAAVGGGTLYQEPALESPPTADALPIASVSYCLFYAHLRHMDHLRLRQLGLWANSLSSADFEHPYSLLSDCLIPSELAVAHIVALWAANDLFCVSDGSYDPKLGKGSHAWVMTNAVGAYRLDGAGPADGDPRSMSSFRPELQGLLASVIMLATIEATFSLPNDCRVTLVCDNESAIQVLSQIAANRFYIVEPSQTDVDLLLEIQGEIHRSNMTYLFVWIRGHQDDTEAEEDLPFLSRLNIDCDRRAKLFLKTNLSPSPPPAILSFERWGAIWGGQKITANLKQAVIEHYTANASTTYIRRKFSWSFSQCGRISWVSMNHAKSKLSMARNTFVTKVLYDKLPVAERLNFFDPDEPPICRSCNLCPETQQHLYQCTSLLSQRHREACWTLHANNILKVGHTSRIIMDAVDANIRSFLCLTPRSIPWQTSQGNRSVFAATQRAVADQSQIGWDKFLFGFVSTKWEAAQRIYRGVSGDFPRRPLRTWTEGLLTSLWEFSHAVWAQRNEVKHGVTKGEQAVNNRARIVALVTDRYLHRPHLDERYRWLFGKPLSERLLDGNRALHVWLTSIKNFSSISAGWTQTVLDTHATFERLTEEALGRLRRPGRRLRRLPGGLTYAVRSGSVFGTIKGSTAQFLPDLWGFTPRTVPVLVPAKKRRKKALRDCVRSHSIKRLFDRGREARHLV
jgi:hypothetical protein